MRIDLRDGQWAEVRERISHGEFKAVVRAIREDDLEFMATLNRAYVRAWSVNDVDGAAIALDASDAFDRMPADVARALYREVVPLWQALNDTAPTPPSSDEPS